MPTSNELQVQSINRAMTCLLFGAFCLRAMAAWFGFNDLSNDPDAYARLAVNWSNSGIYGFESVDGTVTPTAFRPPLYPWLLSWLVVNGRLALVAVALLHIALGVATVGISYAIGLRLNLRFAGLAGVMVAIDPLLVRGAQLVMTETLATFMAVAVWWLALVVWPQSADNARPVVQRHITQWLALVGFGLALGLSVLARPTAAPWALLCVVVLLFGRSASWKRRINDCLLVSTCVLLCLLPWTLRNLSLLGKPIWATTHGGYTLLLANNLSLYDHFSKRGPARDWDPQDFHAAWELRYAPGNAAQLQRPEYWKQAPSETENTDRPPPVFDEVVDDKLAYRASYATIAKQPAMFLLSCLYRASWLWALWPHDGTFGMSEVFIGLWYAMMFMLAVTGLVTLVRSGIYRGWLIGLCLLVSLTAVHAVFWSNMRMRAPAMPCVILLATAALQSLPRRMNISPTTINTPPAI